MFALRRTTILLGPKSKKGQRLSKMEYLKMRKHRDTAGATKPWEKRPDVVGEIHLEDATEASAARSRAPTRGMAPPLSEVPLGMEMNTTARNDASSWRRGAANQAVGMEAMPEFIEGVSSAELAHRQPDIFGGGDAPHASNPYAPAPMHHEDAAPPALGEVPMGSQLNIGVDKVTEYEEGAKPMQVQRLSRTKKEIAESVVIPKHLNGLFHKIMGWSNDLKEKLDDSTGIVEPPADATPQQLKELETKMAKKSYSKMKDKLQYGALMEPMENDQFALEHKLQVAGNKFEKQFMEWKGAKLLDDPRQEMKDALDKKAAMVVHNMNSFSIPRVNRDPCSGCGVTLQDKNENDFGYVASGEIEQYILSHQSKLRARTEYADRMAELQKHWEKNGRRVGEEWLDFMTQEEFQAIYKYVPKPFQCNRCHNLNKNHGKFDTSIMHAPDFTQKLKALKEKKCLIVLVIDITDFPGSMVHDLPGLISMNNPVLIVANKLDVIQQRRLDYNGKDISIKKKQLRHKYIEGWVTEIAAQFRLPRRQIKGVIPVSARRGWGIDQLIESIEEHSNLNLKHAHAPLKTYFVGVCNVGKSSIINAISHKMYVPQPPHPESKKVYYSIVNPHTGKEQIKYRWYTPPHVNKAEMLMMPSKATKEASQLVTVSHLPGTTLAATAIRVSLQGGDGVRDSQGKLITKESTTYLFDTPGLFPGWYESTVLTKMQLARCLQVKYRNPRLFLIRPGHSLFFGGMAVIDVVKGNSEHGFMMAVYASVKVTTELCPTERSDEFWTEEVGKKLYPPGSLEQCEDLRLSESKSYLFECFASKHKMRPKADIYFCGLGWVAFYSGATCDAVFNVRTLPGVIHGVRRPLRHRDMLMYKSWPGLPKRLSSKEPKPAVDKVIELTTGPYDPAEEPIKIVKRVKEHVPNAGSDDPFDQLKDILSQQGKL